MPYIPTPLDELGIKSTILKHDLSSNEKVCQEKVSITLQAGQMEEVDVNKE
jgi:hypothetical protein